MAIQSQPSRISEPFAGSGTKNVIPSTNATPSASQAASWASGFPPECSQPISAGGCPVPRNDVNGVLNWLSQGFAFHQDGGVWEWSALADYDTQRMVRGSDGLLYWSVAQSGPGIAAGAQDPTLDTAHAYWTAIPTDDAGVVHTTGNETIAGKKIFLSNPVVQRNGAPGLNIERTAGVMAGEFIVNASDVLVARVYNNGSSAGYYIANPSGSLHLSPDGGGDYACYLSTNYTAFHPETNNKLKLGMGGYRWTEVYAINGSINTSDERKKQDISGFSDELLDAWEDVDFAQFKMRNAVAEKGEEARIHSGLVAQRIEEAFHAKGIDPARYGFFCHDSWDAADAVMEEEGIFAQPAREAGDEYSLRYEEALCIEAAYQRRRADRAEARLAALEERLGRVESALASLCSPAAEEPAGDVQDVENQ